MKFLKFLLVISILGSWICCYANPNNNGDSNKKIQHIASMSNCIVGVSAIHVEKNKKISYNGNMPFFMASTIKLPIAITLLSEVEKNKEQLNRVIKFDQQSAVPGSGNLYVELNQHRRIHHMTLNQLLRLMLIYSDNTASDLILREVHGPSHVKKQLVSCGFHHISVDRSIYDLYLYSSGLSYYSKAMRNLQSLHAIEKNISPEKKVQAWKRFEKDPRDTATSNEMALLLTRLYQGKLLSPKSTNLLFEIMSECKTGHRRIKGLLPSCTRVAHKTGTWTIYTDGFIKYPGSKQLYRFANDVGIITLPKQRGHIAVAIYVKSTAVSDQKREQTIAKISREIYDYFLQNDQ